jgi:hypothetical protein
LEKGFGIVFYSIKKKSLNPKSKKETPIVKGEKIDKEKKLLGEKEKGSRRSASLSY